MNRDSPIRYDTNDMLQDDDMLESPNNSNSNCMEEELSPLRITRNASLMSDTDSLSDSSRKIRKKRNTYQKISDDIRVQLLEAVKNGETLKSAAKRHKINYSSAKSILHTFRKEGRILKKSAQERSTKKKNSPESEHSQSASKSTRSAKKENMQPEDDGLSVNDRTKSEPGQFALAEKNNNANPRPEGSFSLNKVKSNDSGYYNQPGQQSHNEGYDRNPPVKPFSAMDTENNCEMDFSHRMDDSRNQHRPKVLSQFAVNHYENNNNSNHGNDELNFAKPSEGSNFISFQGSFPGSFDNFNDVTATSWPRKASHNDFHFDTHDNSYGQGSFHMHNMFDRSQPGSMEFEEPMEHNSNFPIRSFLDTKNLLSEVMGKASMLGYDNDDAIYRKGSMDFFS